MPETVTPDCPFCGDPPEFIIGTNQAFCGNDKCTLLMWTPTKSLDDNLLDAGMVKLPPMEDGADDS